MAHDKYFRTVPLGSDLEGADITLEISPEFVVREVDEPLHAVEALIFVNHEDRQNRADKRTERDNPTRGRFPQVGLQLRDTGFVDNSPGVNKRGSLWVLVLAEQQNVVPTLPQFASNPGREDVGAASLKKPAMPEEDPHHLISLAYWVKVDVRLVRQHVRCVPRPELDSVACLNVFSVNQIHYTGDAVVADDWVRSTPTERTPPWLTSLPLKSPQNCAT